MTKGVKLSIGDIILIQSYLGDDLTLQSGHPFIVLSLESGAIQGMEFDVVCNAMSSLEGKGQGYIDNRLAKSSNLELQVHDGVKKRSFVKTDVLHYFKIADLSFHKVGQLEQSILNFLFQLIEKNVDFSININNL